MKQNVLVFLLLVLLAACFFYGVVFKQETFFLGDIYTIHMPEKVFFSERIRAGAMPLWCPYGLLGYPFHAEGQSLSFYPPNLFFAFFPAAQTLAWQVVLHVLLAALCFYFLAADYGLGPAPGILAGITYAFSGFMVAHTENFNMLTACAWLPLLFLWAKKMLERPRFIFALPFCLTACLMVLGGNPHVVFLGFLLTLSYGVFLSIRCKGRRLACLAVLFGCFILVLLLTAVQLLPTLELIGQSLRNNRGAWAQEGDLHPLLLAQFLFPYLLGDPANNTYWGANLGVWNFPNYAVYLGLLPLCLILLFFGKQKRKDFGFFGWAFVLSLVLSLGKYFPPNEWINSLPGFAWFRDPVRFLFIAGFCGSLLAAGGLDRLAQKDITQWKNRLRWFLGIGTAVWVLGAAALLAGWTLRSKAMEAGLAFMQQRVFEKGSHFYPWDYYVSKLTRSLAFLEVHFSLQWIILAACLVLLFLRKRRALSGSSFQTACVILTVLDLFHFGMSYNATISKRFYSTPPQTVLAFQAGLGPYRYFPWRIFDAERKIFPEGRQWLGDLSAYYEYREMIPTNANFFYKYSTLMGSDALDVQRHWTWVDKLYQAQAGPVSLPLEYFLEKEPVLSLSGVRYILTTEENKASFLQEDYQLGKVRIYENKLAVPRAYLADKVGYASSGEEALAMTLRQRPQDFPAILECPPIDTITNIRPKKKGEVVWFKNNPEDIILEVHTQQAKVLVLTDVNYPGWNAKLDGKTTDILTANYLFRGLAVPAGTHVVEFSFEPESFYRGVLISLSVLGVVLLGALVVFIRRSGHGVC